MFLHVFMFQWKDHATAAHRASAALEISDFKGAVPGLLTVTVGTNLAANHGGYDFGGCLGFTDEAAYRDYCNHPLHKQLLDWLLPLIDAVELDLPAA